jgi:serine/threonine-protein kinase
MPAFGRYEIEGKLGEGAMGVVYRARDRVFGRNVALKMLSEELGAEPELLQRFRREAEAIGQLSHPNIVAVYDMGEADGRLYMAMELLEGEDLRTLIERQVALPLAERVGVALQICAGLGYAHAHGIVHRDIKPANILVTSSGHVKVLDFGLAKVASRASITRRGVILGTPDYMAPEQASGHPIDKRTDLFSVGSVLYEFFTLEKPFKGRTLHAVLYQIVQGQPEPLLTLNPEIPARLAQVVHKMLEKDPERRYQNLEDVAGALTCVHDALRRSGGRSAFYGNPPAGTPEELRHSLRECLQRARVAFQARREADALVEVARALAIDPRGEEAGELMWQVSRRLAEPSSTPPPDPAHNARVELLLAQASADRPAAEVQRALVELALIAPDDARVRERLRPSPEAPAEE